MSCDPATSGFQFADSYVLDEAGNELSMFDQGSWQLTNVFGNGELLATYDAKGLHFHLKDALGTRRVQTDDTGAPEEDCTSLPFGDQASCTLVSNPPATADDATPLHFTGKERDTESGNDYFGARYYGNSMGRFLGPDPTSLGQFFDDPQTWNMYSYAHNNPLGYVDKNGKWPTKRHNQIYTLALGQVLTPDQMRIVESVSEEQDSPLGGGQFNSRAYQHAMRGPGQTVEQALAQYDDFVSGQVQAAQEAQINFWEANPGSTSLSNAALRHFAMALHAVTDSTSPAHRGFQKWNWINVFADARHAYKERNATPGQLSDAVLETQELYNQTFGMKSAMFFGYDDFDPLDLLDPSVLTEADQLQWPSSASRSCTIYVTTYGESGNC